jgi:membrane-associated phospholipid phosphatase
VIVKKSGGVGGKLDLKNDRFIMMKKWISVTVIFFALFPVLAQQKKFGTADYVKVLKLATDIMVNDVTSPVAAGRYYAYINLAAYEAESCFQQAALRSFSGKLNGYTSFVPSASQKKANEGYTVLQTVLKIAERLLPSGFLLQAAQDSLQNRAKKLGIKDETLQVSRFLADTIVKQVLEYARLDGFAQLSGRDKYTPLSGDAFWRPTPPGYMAAIEPNWDKLRTFVLPGANAIAVAPPAAFDTAHHSDFYQQMLQVFTTGKSLTASQKNIADFWDCNPFALQQMGHVEFGLKKISPGGHWIGITGIACLKRKLPLYSTVQIHAAVAITMADAFISCWHEKYRSNRIRPETAIRKWLDAYWIPHLQTPPFPEYTSGHSVVSAAVAAVLTKYFGASFPFTDNTEMEFGLPARKFTSFLQAAEEAAISRFYGGIHFMDAITNGTLQGSAIGKIAVEKLL